MKNISYILSLIVGSAGAVLASTTPAHALTYTFTTIDNPNATNTDGTMIQGINDAGQIVGTYNASQGFLYTNGTFTTIDVPITNNTNNYPANAQLYGINNAGQIVGFYSDDGNIYGILDTNGIFTNITGIGSEAYGINNAGQIVGLYYYSNNPTYAYGFLGTSSGISTIINDPSATGGTVANGINDAGQIVGLYLSNNTPHGFLDTNGTFTTIDDPSATGTYAQGINNAGQIVGFYYDSNGHINGFLDTNGTFTTIDDPSATGATYIQGINNTGQIVGFYGNSSGYHGFLATPDTPTVPFDIPGGATIPALGSVLALGIMRKVRKSTATTKKVK